MTAIALYSPASGGDVPIERSLSRSHARPSSSRDYRPLLDSPQAVLFLDIETTGLSRHYDSVTVIGFQLDGQYSNILPGEDLQPLYDALASASSIVTFNGSSFDLPFLEGAFGPLPWTNHHVDLRYACKRLGLTGGQKVIEQVLNIDCREGVEGVDGAAAVLLWHRYLRGDANALPELVRYNRADIRAMTHIVDYLLQSFHGDHPVAKAKAFSRSWFKSRHAKWQPRNPILPRLPTPTFNDLFGGHATGRARIVGLDLTGSAKRLTGYCLAEGPNVTTQLLSEDEAIIETTVAACPDLVSIDSPLCLPVGRTTAFDNDPERHHGIMRGSERILKRRGINVYPCLLPSMQRLTDRGIRIASELRARGFSVIECYPGAAQDIMGIPRKGASETWLMQGMSEFGMRGEFAHKRVTHDELDAITCSIVGAFHLAGMTEGLAFPGEEPLIIPILDRQFGPVVGISGPIMSGKTTLAQLLERQGAAYTRISLVIEGIALERGLKPNRETLQALGRELREQFGQRWLVRRALELLDGMEGPIVVDGLRWEEDVRYLRERFGGRFTHLHVTAADTVREQRAADAGRSDEYRAAIAHPVEQEVHDLARLADQVIKNDGDLGALTASLATTLERIEG